MNNKFWTTARKARRDVMSARRDANLRAFFSSEWLSLRYEYIETESTLIIHIPDGIVKFFPHRNQWMYKGTKFFGDMAKLSYWLKNKLDNNESS